MFMAVSLNVRSGYYTAITEVDKVITAKKSCKGESNPRTMGGNHLLYRLSYCSKTDERVDAARGVDFQVQ